jgi:hypothetical protein
MLLLAVEVHPASIGRLQECSLRRARDESQHHLDGDAGRVIQEFLEENNGPMTGRESWCRTVGQIESPEWPDHSIIMEGVASSLE